MQMFSIMAVGTPANANTKVPNYKSHCKKQMIHPGRVSFGILKHISKFNNIK